MSGASVSTGKNSKQDFGTPADFMEAVGKRFGQIGVDLAAHAMNKKHERYFAPSQLVHKWDRNETFQDEVVRLLVQQGAMDFEAQPAVMESSLVQAVKGSVVTAVRNRDASAEAFDSLAQKWHQLADVKGPGWLNPEFADIDPWAKKCFEESELGFESLLLTPVSISQWFKKHVVGRADVYLLEGRLSFDGKAPYPKDCMVSHFYKGMTGSIQIWDWKNDLMVRRWTLCP